MDLPGYLKVVLHVKPHFGSRQINCKIKGGLIEYACVENGSIVDDHDDIADYINIKVDTGFLKTINHESGGRDIVDIKKSIGLQTLNILDQEQDNESLHSQLKIIECLPQVSFAVCQTDLPQQNEHKMSHSGKTNAEQNKGKKVMVEDKIVKGENKPGSHTQTDSEILKKDNKDIDEEYPHDIEYDFYEIITGDDLCEVENGESDDIELQKMEVAPENIDSSRDIVLENVELLGEVKEELLSLVGENVTEYKVDKRDFFDNYSENKKQKSSRSLKKLHKRKPYNKTKSPRSNSNEKTCFQRKNNPTNITDVVTSITLNGFATFVCNLCGFHQAMPILVHDHVKREHAICDGPLSRMGLLHEGTPKKVLCSAAKLLIEQSKEGVSDTSPAIPLSIMNSESKKILESLGHDDIQQPEGSQSNDERSPKMPDKDKQGELAADMPKSANISEMKYSVFNKTVLDQFLKHHFTIGKGERLSMCKYCDFQGSNNDSDGTYNLLEHSRYSHVKLIERLTCIECMEYFSAIYLLKHHMDVVHGKVAIGKCSGLHVGPSTTWQCLVCQTSFRNVGQFENHMVTHHSLTHKFKCQTEGCSFSSSSEGGLHRHVTRSHLEKQRGKSPDVGICELCGFSTSAKQGIERHQARNCLGTMVKNSEDLPFSCTFCDRHFPSERVLSIHVTAFHSGPFKCPYEGCTKEYKEASTLNTHIARVHQERYRFICETCGATLSDRTALNLHVKTVHRKIKDFVCPYEKCTQRFGRKNALETHIRGHTGEKRLQCQYCTYKANQRASMNHHMKNHHPNERYNR